MFIFSGVTKPYQRHGHWIVKILGNQGEQREQIGQKGHLASKVVEEKTKSDGKVTRFPSVFTLTQFTSTILLERQNEEKIYNWLSAHVYMNVLYSILSEQ